MTEVLIEAVDDSMLELDVVTGSVAEARLEEMVLVTMQAQPELTIAGSPSQFSKYVGISVGSALILVVYEAQKSLASELNRRNARRQLSWLQTRGPVVVAEADDVIVDTDKSDKILVG